MPKWQHLHIGQDHFQIRSSSSLEAAEFYYDIESWKKYRHNQIEGIFAHFTKNLQDRTFTYDFFN
jgi:hypothetical protein